MRERRLSWSAALAAMLMFGNGCIVSVSNTRDPYDRCTSSDVCRGASTCQVSAVATSGMTAGTHCTVSNCGAAGPSSFCPTDPSGALGICVPDGVGGSQCFRGCPTGSCPAGFMCARPSTLPSEAVCVPNGSTGSCGNAGQACCAGNACSSGLVCGASGTCVAACGGVGQPCCAGNACTGGNLCDTSGTCIAPAQPYQGCTPIGGACGGGTTCAQPRIANPDPNFGLCTRDCSGNATECPPSPIPGRSFNCYVLQNQTVGQCFVDCAGADISCPQGTVCTMTTSATNATIRVCMPCPAGMCP